MVQFWNDFAGYIEAETCHIVICLRHEMNAADWLDFRDWTRIYQRGIIFNAAFRSELVKFFVLPLGLRLLGLRGVKNITCYFQTSGPINRALELCFDYDFDIDRVGM